MEFQILFDRWMVGSEPSNMATPEKYCQGQPNDDNNTYNNKKSIKN